MCSGVVLSEDVLWLTFHSGYDFGYILKLCIARTLPETEAEFFELLQLYFPQIFDMKYLMKYVDELHGGLNKLAEILEVDRIGPQHQAGSDSLLTAGTFFKLRDTYFGTNQRLGDIEQYKNVLYGLGVDGNTEPSVDKAS